MLKITTVKVKKIKKMRKIKHKVYLWMGMTAKSKEEVDSYFAYKNTIVNGSEIRSSDFATDVNITDYFKFDIRLIFLPDQKNSAKQMLFKFVDMELITQTEVDLFLSIYEHNNFQEVNVAYIYIDHNNLLKNIKDNAMHSEIPYIGSCTIGEPLQVHIWVGTTTQSEEEYRKYFELVYPIDIDDPNYKVCGFCKDINRDAYDEDMILINPLYESEQPIITMLDDASLALGAYDAVISKCAKLGIERGNAIFTYTDYPSEDIKPSDKIMYNGLHYIGLFDDE